jgi:uncharacterized protein (DUF1501 family)
MSIMERGAVGTPGISTGWIGRHLAALDNANSSPLRAVGWGNVLQQSLRGSVNAVSLKSIVDYHLQGRKEAADDMLAALNAMYAADPTALRDAAAQTNAVLDMITKINVAQYQPTGGANYNDHEEFDLALMQTAALIKAEVGLEVSAIDLGGWDTHQNQQIDITTQLDILAKGLAAFYADLGDLINRVTVIVMSEFGRRVEENASGGTDHGHGNMMMLMGGSVVAKPVVAEWPGLQTDVLDRGDLPITIDYRDVLCEVMGNRLYNPHFDQVFPGFVHKPRGIVTTA